MFSSTHMFRLSSIGDENMSLCFIKFYPPKKRATLTMFQLSVGNSFCAPHLKFRFLFERRGPSSVFYLSLEEMGAPNVSFFTVVVDFAFHIVLCTGRFTHTMFHFTMRLWRAPPTYDSLFTENKVVPDRFTPLKWS